MDRLIRERGLFLAAFSPPVGVPRTAEHEPYDIAQPFNADELLDGFTVEERQVPVDPDSPLGRAMASAREAWAAPDYAPIYPDNFKVEPIPVTDFGAD